MSGQAYFSAAFFQFLRELKTHNNRDWFEKNRDRYEARVKDPMLRFIAGFGTPLRRISPYFEADARPTGGSMFRIYRDIRFSKDKSPYKTHAGAHFPHRHTGRDAHAPGFYLHLEPGRSIGGGGLWHPDAAALKKVRDRIIARPKEWAAVRRRVDVEGETLKRVPAGYDPAHPFAEDLKLKDYYAMEGFSDRHVLAGDFMNRYVNVCRRTAPLMEFLTAALGLPW